MAHRRRFSLLVCGLLVIGADSPAPAWKFDSVLLTNGATFRGLIIEESPAILRFQAVRQQPGRPTVVFSTTFARNEIESIERLSDADRDQLKARLREIDPSAEKQRIDKLELEVIDWSETSGAGRRYRSDNFVLESNAPAPVVRRAAVRLEQVYAAFARYLPPRTSNGPPKPTDIVLLKSRTEYTARLLAEGRRLANVAYFDPAANRVVCASDLEFMGNELEKARQQAQQLRADYDARELALSKLYKGKELTRHIVPIRTARQALELVDRRNEAAFDQATRLLFSTLYHEAFHAYLAACVYRAPGSGPPRWLNEGLAQVFETAVVEAGELRLGHADRDRLTRVKEAMRRTELVPIARLLQAGPNEFLALHAEAKAATDAHYLTAWAVAFHLMFERRLFGGNALDTYSSDLDHGADVQAAFRKLVGQPIDTYERDLHRYLAVLQPDGSSGNLPEKER